MSSIVQESTPAGNSRENAPSRGRLRSVTLAAWLHILQAAVLIGTGLLALMWVSWLPAPRGLLGGAARTELGEIAMLGILATGLGLFALFIAIGLLRLSPWAWLIAMTLQGVSLAVGLVVRAIGNPVEVVLLTSVIVVLVLNQQEVRESFDRSGRQRV